MAENNTKWLVVVNPKASVGKSEKDWPMIKDILVKEPVVEEGGKLASENVGHQSGKDPAEKAENTFDKSAFCKDNDHYDSNKNGNQIKQILHRDSPFKCRFLLLWLEKHRGRFLGGTKQKFFAVKRQ